MQNLFFTSDTHFGHKSIMGYCDRPFTSTDEMDEHIIDIWNKTVAKKDIIYHLGDFAWHSPLHYRKRLNGQVHLILGNHDKINQELKDSFIKVSDIRYLKAYKLFLCHYPMHSWRNSNNGVFHLHGHSHGRSDGYKTNALDVGVDCHDFKPVAYEDLPKWQETE